MSYLEFYYHCLDNGNELPGEGLCASLGRDSMKLFTPTKKEFGNTKYHIGSYLWAATGTHGECNGLTWSEIGRAFTPLRQNIVLLLAAMNNEL